MITKNDSLDAHLESNPKYSKILENELDTTSMYCNNCGAEIEDDLPTIDEYGNTYCSIGCLESYFVDTIILQKQTKNKYAKDIMFI